jgi:O-antigen ligase/tetratricopeptide (TPR) repeat protein
MFRIFLFLLIFAPLAFGTVEPWSYAVMEVLSFSALCLFALKVIRNRESFLSAPGILPFLLFLFYILFQIIPLPPSVIEFLSPSAHSLHAAAVENPNAWMTLSIHPAATLLEFFRWSSYAAFYVLTIQLLRQGDRIRKTVITITIFGALLSFSSILQFYLTDDLALWFRHVPRNSLIVGPYICHNHYAGLMEMMFPVVLGLFFFHRPRTRNLSLIKGIAEILSQEKANIHILIGTTALLIATSVFVSLSRGGMLSLSLSLVFFTYLIFRRKISQSNAILIAVIIFLTTLSVGWFGWNDIIERFSHLKNAEGIIHDSRLSFWKDTIRIIQDFIVTGAGIGSFSDIYPSYQSITGDFLVNHAHNDYLELAAEGGIVGFALAASFVITLFVKTYRAFLSRKDAYAVYLYMGSITGIIALLIHSFFDFNLHVGANGLWFFFLAGLAVSTSTTAMRNRGRASSSLRTVRSPGIKHAAVAAISFLTICTIVFNVSVLIGNYYFSHIRDSRPGPDVPHDELLKIERIAGLASFFEPLNGSYPFARANAAFYLGEDVKARQYFSRAIALNPTNSYYLNRLGGIFASREENEAADRLLAASMAADISNTGYALEYGSWLLSKNMKSQALALIRRVVELDEDKIDGALTTMAIHRLSESEMLSAVPEIPGATMAYADFLYSSGKTDEAKSLYLKALSYLQENQKITRRQFYRLYEFFQKTGGPTDTMKVMLRISERLPSDSKIRITLGDLYRDMGIIYRAEEEYQQALFLEPSNQTARIRLESLKGINP